MATPGVVWELPSSTIPVAQRYPDVGLINNLGIFEAKPFKAIDDADWMRFFGVKCAEGRAPGKGVLPKRKRRHQLGTGHLHLQRKRHSDSSRDDSLRRHQDCPACCGARCCGSSRWDWESPSTASCRVRPDRAGSPISSSNWRPGREAQCRSSRRPFSSKCGQVRSSSASPHRKRWPHWWHLLLARCHQRQPGQRWVIVGVVVV